MHCTVMNLTSLSLAFESNSFPLAKYGEKQGLHRLQHK